MAVAAWSMASLVVAKWCSCVWLPQLSLTLARPSYNTSCEESHPEIPGPFLGFQLAASEESRRPFDQL